ncbi:MAG TPA: methyltransferase [Candidatus Acidoferrum sp.]
MQRGALVVTIVPLVGIALFVYEFAHPPWAPLRIAGLVVMAFALVFLTVSRVQLGNSFSLTPQAKKLVTHGIYSRIRNPIYFFGIFVFTGLFLFLERPWLLLLVVPVLFLQITAPAPKRASSKNTSAMNIAVTEPRRGFSCAAFA